MKRQRHETMGEAVAVIERELAEARRSGNFLVGIWSVTPDGVVMRTRTTWNFPRHRLAAAIGMLTQDVCDEILEPPVDPLPLASIMRGVGDALVE